MKDVSRRGFMAAAGGAFAATALAACSSGGSASASGSGSASASASSASASSSAGNGLDASVDIKLHVPIQHEQASPDWVTALPQAQDSKTNQLFVVAAMGMDKTTATISMHERDASGKWQQVLSTPGFVGKDGLVQDEDHKEGAGGYTPIGTYGFNKAFGIADDPGCTAFEYVKVTDDIYWSGDDRAGKHYNEMVNIKDIPDLDMENSEHIVEYEYQYQYCLNISFNADATPGKGSAIFLHCFGPTKPYTGGCVAVPEYTMVDILKRVKTDCVVVINTLEAMNGKL